MTRPHARTYHCAGEAPPRLVRSVPSPHAVDVVVEEIARRIYPCPVAHTPLSQWETLFAAREAIETEAREGMAAGLTSAEVLVALGGAP